MAKGTKILARGSKPLNQTPARSGSKITPRATNLTTRRKGMQPFGIDTGVRVRKGGR